MRVSVDAVIVPLLSVPVYIDLNFTAVNVFPFFPTLLCKKKRGPFELNLIINIIIKKRGERVIIPEIEKKRSKHLLSILCTIR